jgi:hypothetical protein
MARRSGFSAFNMGFIRGFLAIKKSLHCGGSKVSENYLSHSFYNVLTLVNGYVKFFCQRLKQNAVNQTPSDDLTVSLRVCAAVDKVDIFVNCLVDMSF